MTIKELYILNKKEYDSLFFPKTTIPPAGGALIEYGDWVDWYRSNARNIDRTIVRLYGSRVFEPIEEHETNTDTLYEFMNSTREWAMSNYHVINREYDIMAAEYDPLSNYDKKSTITTTKNGQEIVDNTITGNKIEELQKIGLEKNQNTKKGYDQIDYTKDGEEITTDSSDTSIVRIVEKENSPYDMNSYEENEKTTETENPYRKESNLSYVGRVDSEKHSYSNDYSNDSITSYEDRKDVSTSKYSDDYSNKNTTSFVDRNDVIEERTYGNIGVTTSTQMARDEMSLRWGMEWVIEIIKRCLFDLTY